jgi:phospholipid-binding lipoprotein MlaA
MTTAIARWFSIATLNAVLITPALAMDEDFGDAQVDAVPGTLASVDVAPSATTAPSASNTNNQINIYDDPLTFNALSRITLKQLRVDANASQPDVVKDPFQPINRKVFKFNNTLDKYVLLPVAKTYKNNVPTPVRNTVGNFFSNLREPWNAVNFLLQGNGNSSYKSLGRFTVNTITSLGLADPATQLGLSNQGREDFGQTLGKWGVKSGPFLMLPVLGPSTLRDSAGRFLDVYGRPIYYAGQDSTYWGLSALEGVDARAGFVGVEDLVQGDQYALLRDLYLQRRQYLISGSEQNAGLDNSFGDTDASFGDEPDDINDTGTDMRTDSSPDSDDHGSDAVDHGFGDTDSQPLPEQAPASDLQSMPEQHPAPAQQSVSESLAVPEPPASSEADTELQPDTETTQEMDTPF